MSTQWLIVEGYIDIVPENSFSCMVSKLFIVISVFIYLNMCLDSDLNSFFYYERIMCLR